MEKIYQFKNSAKFSINIVNSDVAKADRTQKYLLTGFEQSTGIKINTSTGYMQDGEDYISNTLEITDITLEVTVFGDDEADFEKLRHDLEKAFNPKLGQGLLINTVKGKSIKCICEKISTPKFDNPFTAIFSIPLRACYPYWQTYEETKKEIALWVGNFHFPLIIPKTTGIIMGHREPSLIVNVVNNGYTETGFKIVFKATGTVKNPSIMNVNTREILKIDTTMTAGQIITVDTSNDPEAISNLNGVETDIMNLIDLDSSFLQLHLGDNLYRYNAEENLDALSIDIYYTEKFIR